MFARVIRPALCYVLVMTFLTGVIYPLFVTGVAQFAFPHQANGSLLRNDKGIVGSELIGQPFDDARYFWGRPSATAPFPYNAAASSGANLGPIEPKLAEALQSRADVLRAAHPRNDGPLPTDLLTASGSGLDPHISPAAARFQASRVAQARGVAEEVVERLIAARIEPATGGILGDPRVNVLLLNLDLDQQIP